MCEKRKRDYQKTMEGQRFMRERVVTLGPDLAAASFLLGRGCRVRFKHQKGEYIYFDYHFNFYLCLFFRPFAHTFIFFNFLSEN